MIIFLNNMYEELRDIILKRTSTIDNLLFIYKNSTFYIDKTKFFHERKQIQLHDIVHFFNGTCPVCQKTVKKDQICRFASNDPTIREQVAECFFQEFQHVHDVLHAEINIVSMSFDPVHFSFEHTPFDISWKANGTMIIKYKDETFTMSLLAIFKESERHNFWDQEILYQKNNWLVFDKNEPNSSHFFKDTPLLIMDEFTSAVGKHIEYHIPSFEKDIQRFESCSPLPFIEKAVMFKASDRFFFINVYVKEHKNPFRLCIAHHRKKDIYTWSYSLVVNENMTLPLSFLTFYDSLFMQCLKLINKHDHQLRIRLLTAFQSYSFYYPLFNKTNPDISHIQVEYPQIR